MGVQFVPAAIFLYCYYINACYTALFDLCRNRSCNPNKVFLLMEKIAKETFKSLVKQQILVRTERTA